MNIKEVMGNGGLISKYFPNYNERQSQIELSESILDSYNEGCNLLANAPTGTGKSLACLIPSILMKSGYKTVVSTATKALQMQYYEKDLPFLHKVFGESFSYCMLKGRSNYVCRRRFIELETDVVDGKYNDNNELRYQFDKVKLWLNDSVDGDLDELDFNLIPEIRSNICSDSDECDGKNCKMSTCYYKSLKIKAKKSNILLVNTDLLATDLVVRNTGVGSVLPHYDTLIIDEAHHFEDTVTKYLGKAMSINVLKSFIAFYRKYINEYKKFVGSGNDMTNYTELDKFEKKIISSYKRFNSSFIDFNTSEDDENAKRITSDDISTIQMFNLKKVKKYLIKTTRCIKDCDDEVLQNKYDKIQTRLEDIISRIDGILEIDENKDKVYWVEYSKRGEPIIENAPIDISEFLKESLFTRMDKELRDMKVAEALANDEIPLVPLNNVVLMSATLTTNNNFRFIKGRLGVQKCNEIILDTPFDYWHNSMLYVPKDIVEPGGGKDKEAFSRQLAQNIIDVSKITDGKMLCIFTSYSEMEKVYDMVKDKVPYRCINQNQYPKKELIDIFKKDTHSILFGTSTFREGISFEGDTCSVVVMDKIPFAVPSEPIVSARIDYLKSKRIDWFNEYYLPQAILALQQANGRLIRNITDNGIVMVCDKRVLTKRYGSTILNSLPEMYMTHDIKKVSRVYKLFERKTEIYKLKNERKKKQ